MTFGDVMRQHSGLGPGFNFLRLALALSVVLFHSFQLTSTVEWHGGALSPAISLLMPAFFALSGFLVAGSMLRVTKVRTFLLLRVIRILPALVVEISISALVMGPIVTSYDLKSYFSHSEFFQYFLNVIGWIHYRLPGVFLTNPLPQIVNGQLWTIPAELHCYILLGALMALGLSIRPRAMLAILLAASVGETVLGFLPGHVSDERLLSSQEMLILCFLCGNVFFLYRDLIPLDWRLFAASIAVGLLTFSFAPLAGMSIGVVAATYIITYLGMKTMPTIPLLMSGDYSYGVYLYSFALQQMVIWALPDHAVWWVNFAIGAPLSILVAAFSWHYVEKPTLLLRRWITPRALPPAPGTGAEPAVLAVKSS